MIFRSLSCDFIHRLERIKSHDRLRNIMVSFEKSNAHTFVMLCNMSDCSYDTINYIRLQIEEVEKRIKKNQLVQHDNSQRTQRQTCVFQMIMYFRAGVVTAKSVQYPALFLKVSN